MAGRRARTGARFLDNADLMAGVDLDRAARWEGASAYVGVLSNAGARPNDIASTLQGVNNIVVGQPRCVLFRPGCNSVLPGIVDRSWSANMLNSEF